jgi:hypothetical protein
LLDFEDGLSELAAIISRGSKVTKPLSSLTWPLLIYLSLTLDLSISTPTPIQGYSVMNLSTRILSSLSLSASSVDYFPHPLPFMELTGLLIPFPLSLTFPCLLLAPSATLCQRIFLNSLAILSSDFNLQNYFCDFSSSTKALQPPPQAVFGYEDIVDETIDKCLPWKIAQKISNSSLQIRACHGRSNVQSISLSLSLSVSVSLCLCPSLCSHPFPRYSPLWSKWLWENSHCDSHRL